MKPIYYFLLLSCVVLMTVSGCKAPYHARMIKYHTAQFIAKGGHADSLKTSKKDSAKVGGTELSGNSGQVVNEDTLKSFCRDLLADELRENTGTIREEKEPVRKPKPDPGKVVDKIQKHVCPQEAIDSVYRIPFTIQGKTYSIPVTVKIRANGGHLEWSVKTGEISAPFVKEEVTANIEVGDSGWKNFKQIAPVAILCLVIGFCAAWVLKTFRIIP